MKNINKLLLCIIFVSAQITLRTENLETQIGTEAGQEAPITITAKSESEIDGIDKAQTKPQDILNTINNVVNMVQTANTLVNQIVPTDNTTTKTNQQATTDQTGNMNIQNILDTTQNVLNIVQNANNFIDQILPIDGDTGTADQIVNNLSASEIEKWKYVNNYFQASIGDLNSYEKIGEFISQNAKFLAMPTVVLYKFLAEKVLTKLSSTTTSDATTDAKKDVTSTTPASSTTKSIKALGSGGIKYITAPIIGGLLTYRIIKFIGARIGTKATKCNTALINFAKDWDTHKEKTPDILWSLFEHLNKELVDNNGKMSQIDAALAQKIIEAIAINASIYEPVS